MSPPRPRGVSMLPWFGLAWLLSLVITGRAVADTRDDAEKLARQVKEQLGSPAKMNTGLAQPLSSSAPMASIDGKHSFGAQVGCPASTAFLQVSMLPGGTGDLSTITIDSDPGFTGNYTSHAALTGPWSGVCSNGVIQCDAGTFSNCRYYQWQASGASNTWKLGLVPVAQSGLGACYCINNYCGSSLALSNSARVLDDISTGITHAINALVPRLTIAHSQYPNVTQQVLYGNQAGCGTDSSPEQYYNSASTSSMAAQGHAAAFDPDSSYYMIQHSQAATSSAVSQAQCSIQRQVELESITKSGVVQVLSRTAGSVSDCGAGCMRLQLGDGHRIGNGGCTEYSDSETLKITDGHYLTSAVLKHVEVDDYALFTADDGVVWAGVPTQYPAPGTPQPSGCENGKTTVFDPAIDLTTKLKADGSHTLKNWYLIEDKGNAYSTMEVHVEEGCFIGSDTVSDGCTSLEPNPDCALQDETVDGVPTVSGYQSTGLQPLPSTQNLDGACYYGPYTAPFFGKQRTYTCKSSTAPYDYSAVTDRYRSVHGSFDTDTGNYTDLTSSSAGTQSSSSQTTGPLPPPSAVPACFQQCETARPGMGQPVGDRSGAMNSLNTSGLPPSYTYKECDGLSSGGITTYSCPLDSGETIVADCACQNHFGEAAAMMQSIRMSTQDSICTGAP